MSSEKPLSSMVFPRKEGSRPPPLSVTRLVVLCVLLVILGPVSLGLFTPALPDIMSSFGGSEGTSKLTMSAFLAGFCVAQLVCGPLSDAYGRRPIACFFLAIYATATILASLSTDISFLIIFRLVQGIGAAVGWSIARAIMRDVLEGPVAAEALSLVVACMAVAPILAPALGGIAVETTGWRGTLALMAIVSLSSLAGTFLFLPETNTQLNPQAVKPRQLLETFGQLLTQSRFVRPAIALGSAVGVMYAMLTVVPFVMIQILGFSAGEFGFLMIPQGAVLMVSSAAASRVVRKMPLLDVARLGLRVQLFGIVVQVVMLLAIGPHALSVLVPLAILGCGSSLAMPAASTLAITPFPSIAGTASSLTGFMQVAAGLVGSLAIAAIPYPLVTLSLVPLTLVVAGLVALRGKKL
jgi:DHA1 family bicyclomycin/chloramphenicol resistance-like MFS transporter